MSTDLSELQSLVRLWRGRNFPVPVVTGCGVNAVGKANGVLVSVKDTDRHLLHATMGVGEEAGELLHVVLKADQRIRGYDDQDKVRAEAEDAIGDICVYLMGVCDCLGLDLYDCVERTARKVIDRDWVADPEKGGQ